MSPDLKLVNGGGTTPTLPVLATLKMAFAFLRSNIGAVGKVSVIPTGLIIIALFFFGAFEVTEEPASPFAMLPSSLITGALMAVIMVAIGKMVLFDTMPATVPFPNFGRDELLTWGASVLSSVATVVAAAVPALVVFALTRSAALAIFAAIVPAIVVAVLLSLIYPVVLTTGRLDFRRTVEMTRKLLPQLFALILLASLITAVVAFAVMSLFLGIAAVLMGEDGMTDFAVQSTAMFMVVIQVLMACVNISVISFAFRWIDYYSPDPLLRGD